MHPAALRPGVVLALGIAGFTAFNAYMPEHAKSVGLSGSQWVFATYSVTCLVLRIVGAKLPERVGLVRAVSIALCRADQRPDRARARPDDPRCVRRSDAARRRDVVPVPVADDDGARTARPMRSGLGCSSSFTMFFDVGTIIGALVLGVVADLTSKRGGFFGGAVMCSIGLVLLWRGSCRGPASSIARPYARRGRARGARRRLTCRLPASMSDFRSSDGWRRRPDWCRAAGRRAVLPGRAEQGRPLRRLVRHGRAHHRDLLPPVLPGDDAEAAQRRVLPHRCHRPAARLPGVQALPARRQPRLAGVEPACRCRRSGDAPDRRRARRPRGRRRSRPPPRLQHPPGPPAARRRARLRPARARPGAACPDRAGADRDDDDAEHRHRVRRRLLQRAPVQRHDPRGVRRLAVDLRGAVGPPPAAGRRRSSSRCASPCARRSIRRRVLDFLERRAVPGVEEVRDGTYSPVAAARRRAAVVDADTGRRLGDVRAAPRVARRHAGRRAALPAAARPRQRPDDDRRAARRRPAARRARRQAPGAALAGTSRRGRAARARDDRPAGVRRRSAHDRRPPRRRDRRAARRRRSARVTHAVPDAAAIAARGPERHERCPRSRATAIVGACDAAGGRRDRARRRRGPRGDVAPRSSRWTASVRGPRATWRCAPSATRTCSCRPTSACATRSTRSASTAARPPPADWPSAGDRGARTRCTTCGRRWRLRSPRRVR